MIALALTLHILQPQIPHLRKPTLLADDAPIAPPPVQMFPPAAQAAPGDLHVAPAFADPLAGSFSFAELGLGALGVAATTTIVGLANRAVPSAHGDTFAIVSAVVYFLVTPLVVAAIARNWAGPNAAGSFGKALLRASLVEAGGLLLCLGVLALVPTFVAFDVMIAAMGIIELVGLPLAASYGAHAGPSHPLPAAPTETIRSEMPPVAQAGVQMPSLAVAFRF